MLREWLEAVLAVLFPQRCPACRKWIDDKRLWCPECLKHTAKLRQIALRLHNLVWLEECVVIADYSGPVQRLIRDMKFRQATRQAGKLSDLLAYAIPRGRYIDIDMVVPVPLHAARQQERGFNQTALIFKPWAVRQNLNWQEVLVRMRPTAPQWELNLKERRKNIKGAFVVTRPELIRRKNILLVDDIFTSGITMEECARTLKKAGAKSVKALALASGAQ